MMTTAQSQTEKKWSISTVFTNFLGLYLLMEITWIGRDVMKKEVRPFIFTLIVLVILIAAYPSYRLFSKVSTESKIENLLEQKDYEQDISKKEMKYDSKTGRYYLEVRYENEADYTYTYEVIDDKILTIAYDQKKSEVTTPLKHYLK